MIVSFIIWNFNPDILHLGPLTIRWYGILFAMAFICGIFFMQRILNKEGLPPEILEKITIYVAVGTIIGARLGHILFYQPAEYFANPMEIFKIWHGGLASHGAAIGILIALGIFSYKVKKSFFWTLDRVVIMVALGGAFIRCGNLANSEIYGFPTNSSFGFVYTRPQTNMFKNEKLINHISFEKIKSDTLKMANYKPILMKIEFQKRFNEEFIRSFIQSEIRYALITDSIHEETNLIVPADKPLSYTISRKPGKGYVANIIVFGIPRHPTHLYEAFAYLGIFILLMTIYYKKNDKIKPGFYFGLFLILLFSARFLIEFLKENQVAFENSLPLNMGQWLSLPFILGGIIILIVSLLYKPVAKTK